MEISSAIKIQAIWRGYRSRKGEVLPCYCCGWPMTLNASLSLEKRFYSDTPCSWCQEAVLKREMEEMGDYYQGYKGESEVRCQDCDQEQCLCDPYIPCCMCGANCYGDDYEKWRFCSRSCMVRAGRD